MTPTDMPEGAGFCQFRQPENLLVMYLNGQYRYIV